MSNEKKKPLIIVSDKRCQITGQSSEVLSLFGTLSYHILEAFDAHYPPEETTRVLTRIIEAALREHRSGEFDSSTRFEVPTPDADVKELQTEAAKLAGLIIDPVRLESILKEMERKEG